MSPCWVMPPQRKVLIWLYQLATTLLYLCGVENDIRL